MQGLTTKFELTNERADLISLKALNFKHSRRNSFQFFDLFSAVCNNFRELRETNDAVDQHEGKFWEAG